jgi:hypothetical protein
MVLRSLRTAKAELEVLEEPLELLEEEPEAVAARVLVAAPAPAVVLEPVPLAEELPVEALLVPPPETVSPTSPESETIVPPLGA